MSYYITQHLLLVSNYDNLSNLKLGASQKIMSLSPESPPDFYQGVVSPEEFLAGVEHALPLTVLEERARRGHELGVFRRVIRGVTVTKYALEFAPLISSSDMDRREGWTALNLRWTNLMYRNRPYINTPTEHFNDLGLVFNQARLGPHPTDISQLEPKKEILGYVVERDYAKQAAMALDPEKAREYRALARIIGIYIPEPQVLAA